MNDALCGYTAGLHAMTWEVLDETAVAIGYASKTAKCKVISTFYQLSQSRYVFGQPASEVIMLAVENQVKIPIAPMHETPAMIVVTQRTTVLKKTWFSTA